MQELSTESVGFDASSDPLLVAEWLRDRASSGVPYRIIFDDLLRADFSQGALDTTAAFEFDTASRNCTEGLEIVAPAPGRYTIRNSGGRFLTHPGFYMHANIPKAKLAAGKAPVVFLFADQFFLSGKFVGSIYPDTDYSKKASSGVGISFAKFLANASFNTSGMRDFHISDFWRGVFSSNSDAAERHTIFFERGVIKNIAKAALVINMPAAKGSGKATKNVSFRSLHFEDICVDAGGEVALGVSSCEGVLVDGLRFSGAQTVCLAFEETDGLMVNNVSGRVRHEHLVKKNSFVRMRSGKLSSGAFIPNKDVVISGVRARRVGGAAPGSTGLALGDGTANPVWSGGSIRDYRFTGFDRSVRDLQTSGAKDYSVEPESTY